MFKSRLKQSKSIFNLAILVKEPTQDSGASCILNYPELPEDKYISKLSPFIFPCPHRNSYSENYTIILTDGDGNLEFVVCRYLADAKLAIAISSYLPCFEILHFYAGRISNEGLHNDNNHSKLLRLLKEIKETPIPSTKYVSSVNLPINVDGKTQSFSIPHTSKPTFYLMDMLEFISALDKTIWIQIFGFVLLEYRVLFHSTHLKRLTACIMSLLYLIQPLSWDHLIYPVLPESMIDFTGCPSPYIAGIPTCLLKSAQSNLNPGTIIVNLNDNYYSTVGLEVTESLPKCLRNYMLKKWKQYERSLTKNDLPLDNVKKFVRIFQQSMAASIGGYRSAFVQNSSTSIEFNKDLFFQSRGADMEQFLSQINESQMFRTFIQDRLDYHDDLKIDAFELDARNFNPKELQSQRISNAVYNLKKNIRIQGTEKIQTITNKVRDIQKRKISRSLKPESITRWDSDPAITQSLHPGHAKQALTMNRYVRDDLNGREGYLTDEDVLDFNISQQENTHQKYRISTTLITDEELDLIMKQTVVRPPSACSSSSDEVESTSMTLSQDNILDIMKNSEDVRPIVPPPRPAAPPPRQSRYSEQGNYTPNNNDVSADDRPDRSLSMSSSTEQAHRKSSYPPPDRTIPVIPNKPSPKTSVNDMSTPRNYTSPSVILSPPRQVNSNKPVPPPRPPPLQTKNKSTPDACGDVNLMSDKPISSNALFADFDPLLESSLTSFSQPLTSSGTDSAPDLLLSMDALITSPHQPRITVNQPYSPQNCTNPFLNNNDGPVNNMCSNSLSRTSVTAGSPNFNFNRVPQGRSYYSPQLNTSSFTESAYFSPAESFSGMNQRGTIASFQSGYSSATTSFYQTPRQSFTSISADGGGVPVLDRGADLQDPFQDVLNQSLSSPHHS